MRLTRILNNRRLLIAGVLSSFFASPMTVTADMNASEREQLDRLQRDVQILKRQVQELRQQRGDNQQPATAPRRGLSLGSIPALGSKDAKVALIEFSDYQCPYCARFHERTFDRIKKKYIDSGKLLYAYRDLPSPSRPQAVKAAIAARCAGVQGKYFEMQKVLFKNGSRLKNTSYVKFARQLGLDIGKYEACLINDQLLDRIESDMVEGHNLGIRGTPTFFIGTISGKQVTNASQLVGALPYTTFKRAIEKALK